MALVNSQGPGNPRGRNKSSPALPTFGAQEGIQNANFNKQQVKYGFLKSENSRTGIKRPQGLPLPPLQDLEVESSGPC